MFASSKSDLRMLPPTDDAFNLHLLRALYQLALYKTAHLSNPTLPPATEFGRVLINGRLCPLLMTIQAKPNILQPVSCKCKNSKCLRSCSCTRAGVLCCVRCSCLGREPTCGRVTADISSSDEDDWIKICWKLTEKTSCLVVNLPFSTTFFKGVKLSAE